MGSIVKEKHRPSTPYTDARCVRGEVGTSGSPRWIFAVVVGAVVVVAGAIVVDAGAGAVVVGAAVPVATSSTCASTSLS